MRARHHPLLAEGAEHTAAIGLGEGGERLVGALGAHHLACDHDGALGAREVPGDVLDCLRRGRAVPTWAERRRWRVAGRALGDVLRQRNGDRPGPSVHGNCVGLRSSLRDLLRRLRLEHRLGQRPQHAVIVDLLKGLPAALPRRHLADKEKKRYGILARGVDSDRAVGGAGPASYEGDTRLAREPAVGAGGEGGTGFMAGDDEAEPILRRPQRFEDGEVTLARHAERGIDAVIEKGLDQRIAAGDRAVCRVFFSPELRAGSPPTADVSRLDRTRHGPPPLKPREDTGRRPVEKAMVGPITPCAGLARARPWAP